MDTTEFVRLELLVVGALFAGLALLLPKIIKAVKGGTPAAPPAAQPQHDYHTRERPATDSRLIIDKLGSIGRLLEKADDSRSKFHARIDKQAEALAKHEKECYERATKTEVRLGRIEEILKRLDRV